MNDAKPMTGWQANIRKQTVRLAWWTIAWLLTMAAATFGPIVLWASNTPLTIVAIGINVLVGTGMIVANKNHLKSLDELQQKVTLEAMGLTLGVGLVVGLAYSNLDVADVIGFDAEISHLVVIMALTYIAATAWGRRKYL